MSFLEHAQNLARLGYNIFQCEPHGKTPFFKTASSGCDSATDDIVTITKWWQKFSDCNIGIKCCNILVLDLDNKGEINGSRDLEHIVSEMGALPSGPVSKTGSGGFHLFFQRPDVDIIGAKRLKFKGQKTGIDIQVGSQYIVAPPSVHPNGNCYEFSSQMRHETNGRANVGMF